MAIYLCIAFAIDWKRGQGYKQLMEYVFNAATFTASLALLTGILHSPVLTLLGSMKPFLLISGFAGVCYSVIALIKVPDHGDKPASPPS